MGGARSFREKQELFYFVLYLCTVLSSLLESVWMNRRGVEGLIGVLLLTCSCVSRFLL